MLRLIARQDDLLTDNFLGLLRDRLDQLFGGQMQLGRFSLCFVAQVRRPK